MVYSGPPSKSSATISASSVGETDIQTPSKYAQYCCSRIGGRQQTCGTHCTFRKRRVQEVIQGEASLSRLLSHQRYNSHGLTSGQATRSGSLMTTRIERLTFEAQ